ncbi:hypothetical protein F4782DRAFT_505382 [Xylaria castorea]|nr:hypothetical protein F4782DRAFT_505382 [Xylaria castorea]
MSGALTSRWMVIHQVRIYLDAKSAPMRFDELEVVGEAISIPFGPSRALTLNLDHSWGVGIKTWFGPTVGGDQSLSDPAAESQSGMATLEASPVYRGATPTAGRHCMNPEATEFYPRTPTGREYSTPTQTWDYPSSNVGGLDAAFVYQYPLNMHPDRSPAFSEMLPPIGGYYNTQIDPYVPLIQNMAQHTWNPHAQGQKYYNYGTQRWEPEWVDFPHIFGYA